MILRVCCPKSDCGGFQGALLFLKSFGIEPALEMDEEGHYFEFKIPRRWSEATRKRFRKEWKRRTFLVKPECVGCGGTEELYQCQCDCGNICDICRNCLETGNMTMCPQCP